MENVSGSDGLPADSAFVAPGAEPGKRTDLAGILTNHKGKLAVGVAAMLGIAIYYRWREHKLAKEDPEEYARLQRVKTAIGLQVAQLSDDNDQKR